MGHEPETCAMVALLRTARRPWSRYSAEVAAAGSALAILQEEEGLFADESLERATQDLERWAQAGLHAITVLDDAYPDNLRAVEDRPPLLFVAGRLTRSDDTGVAVVGTRTPSTLGRRAAETVAVRLVEAGYTVVSGLAAGIDGAAHRAALARGGRTVAVIGNGLLRCYPPEHAGLQHEITATGAVVSQFWPESPPTKRTFPMRNAVMSGLSLATVIVEAGPTSGTRIQARLARAQRRPVLLLGRLLEQDWARELAEQSGVEVVHTPAEIADALRALAPRNSAAGAAPAPADAPARV
jgi:DNA processing protein